MAEVLYLNDGTSEIIENDYEFAELIKERLGHDCCDKILDLKKAADYTERKIYTDIDVYESELESDRMGFRDLMDILEKMDFELSQKRINRNTLTKMIKDMKTEISNHY